MAGARDRVCARRARGHYGVMGTFDTLHTGERCGQFKCFGKGMRNLRLGDRVTRYEALVGTELHAVALLVDDLRAAGPSEHPGPEFDAAFGRLIDGDARDTADFQVATSRGFVTVIDHVIVAWDDVARADLLLVDNHGRERAREEWLAFDERAWADPEGVECPICEDLRWVTGR